jgi:hypothetical protein
VASHPEGGAYSRLRLFKNRLLKRTFGSKVEEVMQSWLSHHNELDDWGSTVSRSKNSSLPDRLWGPLSLLSDE